MLLQPCPGLLRPWRLRSDDIPEPRRMVIFEQMSQLMNDDIINDKHRCLYESPIQMDSVLDGAGSPTIAVIDYARSLEGHAEVSGMSVNAWQDLLVGPASKPRKKSFSHRVVVGAGDNEAIRKIDAHVSLPNHVHLVLSAEI